MDQELSAPFPTMSMTDGQGGDPAQPSSTDGVTKGINLVTQKENTNGHNGTAGGDEAARRIMFHPDYSQPPSNCSDAIVIRTSDGIHYYHSVSQLAIHSTVFMDLHEMSALNRKTADVIETLPFDNINGRGLETILKAIFPPWDVIFGAGTVERLHEALQGAKAYDFHTFARAIRIQLQGQSFKDEFTHFALAVAFEVDEDIEQAAIEAVTTPATWLGYLDDRDAREARQLLNWCSKDHLQRYDALKRRHLSKEDDLRRELLNHRMHDYNEDYTKSCAKKRCQAYRIFHGNWYAMQRNAIRKTMNLLNATNDRS